MKVVLFCGGRGSNSIIRSLVQTEDLELILLVNGYDDGKSTGTIRRLIPGFLGPSDFRKNISNLLSIYPHQFKLAEMFEHRLTNKDLCQVDEKPNLFESLRSITEEYSDYLTANQFRSINLWLERVSIELNSSFSNQSSIYEDMAFGNLILAGSYLESHSSFNNAVDNVCAIMNVPARLLNITDGSNKVLVAIENSGNILENEASIVEKPTLEGIAEIFLLDSYLSERDLRELVDMNLAERIKHLRQRQSLPVLNSDAQLAIRDCNLIVYGPGTQHSSLLPSYMTLGLGLEIARAKAEKVLVGNITLDNDITNENLRTLIQKLEQCFTLSAESQSISGNFLDQLLLSSDTSNYHPWGLIDLDNPKLKICIGQLSNQDKVHDGKRVVSGLLSMVADSDNFHLSNTYKNVSIVLPNLNEERTLGRVLEKLYFFDWLGHGIIPEFNLIDGGSTDNSLLIAKRFPGVKVLSLIENLGRGKAISEGVQMSSGEFIITFPTDDEYKPEAIVQVFNMLIQNPTALVFGTRATLSVDSNERLRKIYEGNWGIYVLSKWGGFVLTILAGIRFKRWLSDPLTSVKGFHKVTQDKITLKGNSLNWDTRLIVDAYAQGIPILEVPVDFAPRNRLMGKKVRVKDGLAALIELLT
jgi:2-phospho-L-lactate transferase/gluconeogenesis factor (CofD/UPF0052 family)